MDSEKLLGCHHTKRSVGGLSMSIEFVQKLKQNYTFSRGFAASYRNLVESSFSIVFILPNFDYCLSIWGNCGVNNSKRFGQTYEKVHANYS